jgi:hypothetical protein
VLLHDNMWPYSAACTVQLLRQFKWEFFDHPLYSLDLALITFNYSSTLQLS